MKKFLLTFGFCLSLFFTYAQCVVSSFKGNNGGGSCDPLLNGDVATGTITICFDVPVTEATAPDITCVFDITNSVFIEGLTFVLLKVDAQGCAVYCYYEGPNNTNNLFGANTSYSFCANDPVTGLDFCVEEGALPVNFRSFTAARNRSNVGLTWTTSQEQNNAGFQIQRLIGNSGWQNVGFVVTQAQGGNSNSDLTYTYNDVNNTKGITQYRLRQVDLDSRSKLSNIRAVRGEGQNVRPIIYPNPSVGGRVNVALEDVNGSFDVSLINLNGRIVKEWRRLTNNSIQIENLTPGIYNLRILSRETGEQTVEKIVVVKN